MSSGLFDCRLRCCLCTLITTQSECSSGSWLCTFLCRLPRGWEIHGDHFSIVHVCVRHAFSNSVTVQNIDVWKVQLQGARTITPPPLRLVKSLASIFPSFIHSFLSRLTSVFPISDIFECNKLHVWRQFYTVQKLRWISSFHSRTHSCLCTGFTGHIVVFLNRDSKILYCHYNTYYDRQRRPLFCALGALWVSDVIWLCSKVCGYTAAF